MNPKNIIILYGGKSPEHEISVRSARNIAQYLDTSKFNAVLVGVSKKGTWHLKSSDEIQREDIVLSNDKQLSLIPGNQQDACVWDMHTNKSIGDVYAVFNIIHGTGEDGSLQGLLKQMNLPFVGPGVISSGLCIDKEVAKRILNEAGIQNSKFLSYTKAQKNEINFETLENELGMPVYIKPPNLGSSVGISKVSRRDELQKAIDEAFSFDKKVLIESNIVGRELECAVLGNENPKASPVGEVVTVGEEHTFYSYDAKYIDANGSVTVIPAEIDPKIQERIQKVAIQTYKALECEGLARVDVF